MEQQRLQTKYYTGKSTRFLWNVKYVGWEQIFFSRASLQPNTECEHSCLSDSSKCECGLKLLSHYTPIVLVWTKGPLIGNKE